MIHDTSETSAKLIQRMINLATSYRKEARGHAAKATSWSAMNRLRHIPREVRRPGNRTSFSHWAAIAADNVLSVACNSAPDEAEAARRYDQARYLLAHMLDPTKT